MAAVNRLAEFLPGGTFLTFTVLAQITADPNRMTQNLNMRCAKEVLDKQIASNVLSNKNSTQTLDGVFVYNATEALASLLQATGMSEPGPEITPCYCGDAVETCGGKERYWLTAVLVIITGLICFILALTNTSLDEVPTTEAESLAASTGQSHATPAAHAPPPQLKKQTFTARMFSGRQQQEPSKLSATPSGPVITDEMLWNIFRVFTRFCLFDWLRAVGSTVIFLVLALLTPPVSTCFYPCMAPVVSQAIPLIIAFGISALLAVWNAAVRKAKKQQIRAEAARRQQQKMQELEQKAKMAEQQLQEQKMQNASLMHLPTVAGDPVTPTSALPSQQNNLTIRQEKYEVALDMPKAQQGSVDIVAEDDTMTSAFAKHSHLEANRDQHQP